MTRRLRTFAIPLILGFFLVGCGQKGRSVESPFEGDPRDNTVRIHVTNLNFMDATLWAVTTGSRTKLGILTGKRQEVYTIPWDFSTDLRIEIDLLASGKCTTEALPVSPGEDIELIINLEMTNSSLCGGR